MATQTVDFYILNTAERDAALTLACKLAEQAFRAHHHVHLHCTHQAECEQLDALLWSFRADSFLPHNRLDLDANCERPPQQGLVTLGHGTSTPSKLDVLVQLSNENPLPEEACKQIIEIITNDVNAKQAGRKRYRAYQQLGYTLHTHKQ